MLSACSLWQTQEITDTDWQTHQKALSTLRQWTVQGKLGIRTAEQSLSATLNWQQTQEDYRIQLAGPLGQGKVIIDGKPGAIQLLQAGQSPLLADDPEQLLEQQLGWHLPINQAVFWIRGLPDPSLAIETQQLTQGVLTQLEQGGWQLQFSRYQLYENKQLPGKILLQRPKLKITLILKSWQLE